VAAAAAARLHGARQPKVRDDAVPLGVHQDVGCLEVAVHHLQGLKWFTYDLSDLQFFAETRWARNLPAFEFAPEHAAAAGRSRKAARALRIGDESKDGTIILRAFTHSKLSRTPSFHNLKAHRRLRLIVQVGKAAGGVTAITRITGSLKHLV